MINKVNICVGDLFNTNEGYIVEVVEYINRKNVTVKFDDKNIIIVRAEKLIKGEITNKNHPKQYGIAFIGVGKYDSIKNPKAFSVWCGMLNRCYCVKLRNLSYYGCTVSIEWLNFQIFCVWFIENYVDGFQIDKDLLVKGNKIYCKDNCTFYLVR